MPLPNIDYAPGQDSMNDVFDKTNDGLDVAGLGLISATDTTYGYLDAKIVESTGITKTILNPGANESIELKLTPIEAWVSVDVTGGDVASGTVKYRKDSQGQVYLMGSFIFDGAVGANSATLFTIPSGYRPLDIISFACTDRSSGGPKDVLALSINTSGIVSWITEVGSTFNGRRIHVDGINFFID